MKIFLRHLGHILDQAELVGGELTIGRSRENNLKVALPFISRKHGLVYPSDGKWLYQDFRVGHPNYSPDPVEITRDAIIDIEGGVELIAEDRLFDAITLVMRRALTPDGIFRAIRSKVVEFETILREEDIEDFRQYAGMTEEDFQASAGFATGFLVGPGIVLTAFHCLRQRNYIDVDIHFGLRTQDGKLHKPGCILGFDTKRDYLFLHAPSLEPYGHLEISTDYRIGSKVYTVGNVMGEGIAIREGILASRTRDANQPEIDHLRFSAASSPGNSGGPLVNGFGEAIGVVYAGNFTENYNLASPAEALLEGKKRFVDDRSPKEVQIDCASFLNFEPMRLLQFLGFPYVPSWGESPEYMLPFQILTARVKVPSDLKVFAGDLLSGFSRVLRLEYDKVLERMAGDGKGEIRWSSQVSDQVRVVAPRFADPDAEEWERKEGVGLLAPCYSALLPPINYSLRAALTSWRDSGVFSVQPFGLIAQLACIESDSDGREPTAKYSSSARYKMYLEELANQPHIAYLFRWNSAATRPVLSTPRDPQRVMKELAQPLGALFDTRYTPFARPKSQRPFSIDEIDEAVSVGEVIDEKGRRWNLFTCQMFNAITIHRFELPIPNGAFYVSWAAMTTEPELTTAIRSNFVRYLLSEITPGMIFWEVDPLIADLKEGRTDAAFWYRDVGLSRMAGGGLQARLRTLGLEFEVTTFATPRLVRFNGMLVSDHGQPKWIASGFDVMAGEGESLEMYGVEVELEEFRTSTLPRCIEKARSEIKPGDPQPELGFETLDVPKWGRINVHRYRVPVQKKPGTDRLLSPNFKLAKPLEGVVMRLL
jgi:hypothetical protein